MSWLWAKLSKYAMALGGLLAIIASAVAVGWMKGRAGGKAKATRAKQRLDDAKAVNKAHEDREHVDEQVDSLPDAPPQKLADAAPDTAAGHLRDDGWLRDDKPGD